MSQDVNGRESSSSLITHKSTLKDEGIDRGLSALVNIPASVASNPPPPDLAEGTVKPIKKLKVKHRRMIALYLQGYNYNEIARALGCNPVTVGAVIRNPTVRGVLERAYSEYDHQLKALVPLGIDAIRDCLLSGEERVRLQAVDRLFGAIEQSDKKRSTDTTAEDVIRRIISVRHGDSEVTVADEVRR